MISLAVVNQCLIDYYWFTDLSNASQFEELLQRINIRNLILRIKISFPIRAITSHYTMINTTFALLKC